MYYDINEATILCGYEKKPTMINYLCRQGLIFPSEDVPSGKGKKRLFTFRDLLILKIYGKMLDAGLSVLKLKKALIESEDFQALSVTKTDLKCNNIDAQYLVTDGKSVYFCAKKDQIIEIGTSGQFVFAFMCDVGTLFSKLQREVYSLEKKRKDKNYKSKHLTFNDRKAV